MEWNSLEVKVHPWGSGIFRLLICIAAVSKIVTCPMLFNTPALSVDYRRFPLIVPLSFVQDCVRVMTLPGTFLAKVRLRLLGFLELNH